METVESVVSSFDFCRNFPVEPGNALKRDHLYQEVGQLSATGKPIFVEGKSLSGKSEFLAGYMRRNSQSTAGVFLAQHNSAFFCADYVRLVLFEQMYFILMGTPSSADYVDEKMFSSIVYRIQKEFRKSKFTFVVDGLCDSEREDLKSVSQIFDVLPFGAREFSFIFSSSPEFPRQSYFPHASTTFPLTTLAVEEARSFFESTGISSDESDALRLSTSGLIGHLDILRRQLLDGKPVDELLSNDNSTLAELFDHEWSGIPANPNCFRVMAFVAFAGRPMVVPHIASLAGIGEADCNLAIEQTKILEIDPVSRVVSFRSETHLRMSLGKLGVLKNEVHQSIIEELLVAPEDPDAIQFLPRHLSQLGRHEELIRRLDSQHFVRLLDAEGSLQALRRRSNMGIQAARTLNYIPSQLLFSLNASLLAGLNLASTTESQIETLVTLGNTDQAVEIAVAAGTKEEQARLLALTAKCIRDAGGTVDQQLKERITKICSEIDWASLGSKTVEIACNLLNVNTDLALSIALGETARKTTFARDWDGVALRLLAENVFTKTPALSRSLKYLAPSCRM